MGNRDYLASKAGKLHTYCGKNSVRLTECKERMKNLACERNKQKSFYGVWVAGTKAEPPPDVSSRMNEFQSHLPWQHCPWDSDSQTGHSMGLAWSVCSLLGLGSESRALGTKLHLVGVGSALKRKVKGLSPKKGEGKCWVGKNNTTMDTIAGETEA